MVSLVEIRSRRERWLNEVEDSPYGFTSVSLLMRGYGVSDRYSVIGFGILAAGKQDEEDDVDLRCPSDMNRSCVGHLEGEPHCSFNLTCGDGFRQFYCLTQYEYDELLRLSDECGVFDEFKGVWDFLINLR